MHEWSWKVCLFIPVCRMAPNSLKIYFYFHSGTVHKYSIPAKSFNFLIYSGNPQLCIEYMHVLFMLWTINAYSGSFAKRYEVRYNNPTTPVRPYYTNHAQFLLNLDEIMLATSYAGFSKFTDMVVYFTTSICKAAYSVHIASHTINGARIYMWKIFC